MVKSGQVWSGVFVSLDATGALSAATTGPAGVLYVDGTANGAAVTISGTNPYKWTVTLPTLTTGQCVSMYITATVATIATASVVAEDVADTVALSDVNTALATVDGIVDSLLAVAPDNKPAVSATGEAAVNVTLWLDAAAPAMTGDAYAVVTNATYGLDKLARTGADGDTLETLSDQLDAIDVNGTAAAVWAYTPRTLTQTAAAVASVMAGTSLTITRGDTLSVSIAGLGSIANRTKLWFTVKRSTDEIDAASVLQVEETAGLIYANGATYGTAAHGTITVTSEAAGNITIGIDEAATAWLVPATGYVYDVQVLRSTGAVNTLTSGLLTVAADVTRAVA